MSGAAPPGALLLPPLAGRLHAGRRRLAIGLAALLLVGSASACGGRRPPRAAEVGRGYSERGLASWYGPGFHGKRTASGEVYDMHALTAAHKTLPFGVVVEVENLDNGRRTRVRINDRGPFVRGRIIDMSRAGAERLGMIGPGTARVVVRVVKVPDRPLPSPGWWVQLGAFRSERNARALADRLRRDYPEIRVHSEGGWHRVGLGPFDDRDRAEELARRLNAEGRQAFVLAAG